MFKILRMALVIPNLSLVRLIKSVFANTFLLLCAAMCALHTAYASDDTSTIVVVPDTFEETKESGFLTSSSVSGGSATALTDLTTGCQPIQIGQGPAFSEQILILDATTLAGPQGDEEDDESGGDSGIARGGDDGPPPKKQKAKKKLFPIYTKAKWLPSKPAKPDEYLKGVDSDKDCVRDDVELFIGELLPKASDYQARTYLLHYARWLGLAFKFEPNHSSLAFNNIRLDEATNRTIANQQSRNAVCFRRIHNQAQTSQEILNKVFAKFYGTRVRSKAYRLGASQLSGWDPKYDRRGHADFSCS